MWKKNDLMQVSLMGNQGGADIFPLKMYQEKHETLLDITPAYLPKVNAHETEIHVFVADCLAGNVTGEYAKQGTNIQKKSLTDFINQQKQVRLSIYKKERSTHGENCYSIIFCSRTYK